MKAIVNATPLISLALIDRLDLLAEIFDEIIVPATVLNEVVVQGKGRPGAEKVANFSRLTILSPAVSHGIDPRLFGLDAGETEVLLLAQQIQPDWVIIDERLARRIALAMELPLKGTLGLLLTAVQADLLAKEEALEDVQKLTASGIRIAPRLLRWFASELEENQK